MSTGALVLPRAPSSLPPDAQAAWNQLVMALEIRDRLVVKGQIGKNYAVSGPVTVSTFIDSTSISTTATQQTLVKLLKDLKNSGLIQAIFTP